MKTPAYFLHCWQFLYRKLAPPLECKIQGKVARWEWPRFSYRSKSCENSVFHQICRPTRDSVEMSTAQLTKKTIIEKVEFNASRLQRQIGWAISGLEHLVRLICALLVLLSEYAWLLTILPGCDSINASHRLHFRRLSTAIHIICQCAPCVLLLIIPSYCQASCNIIFYVYNERSFMPVCGINRICTM